VHDSIVSFTAEFVTSCGCATLMTAALETVREPDLSIWQRLKLLCGRPRRLLLQLFFRQYVRASLARRRGTCQRCGVCCRMGLCCPDLRYENGLAGCARYEKYRSPNCRNFPLDERDLAERDVVSPQRPCGFSFCDPSGAVHTQPVGFGKPASLQAPLAGPDGNNS
jgi:hypothetical protein